MKMSGIQLFPNITFFSIITLISFFTHQQRASASGVNNPTKFSTYIVHVKLPEHQVSSNSVDLESFYKSFFTEDLANSGHAAPSRIIYSYHNVIRGFAARLSPEEVKAMENKEGFVMARPEKTLHLHTTHSPNFLGLHQDSGFWKESNFGEGVIIGLLDSGIASDHPSFSDEGMPPPPAKWKGKCDLNGTKCNNKVIGARNFVRFDDEVIIPDENGHGTHTASTAAGNFVDGANVFDNANGTAAGIAPRAYLAIYRVCSFGCLESAILAAMDAAIDDGVDILSISLGIQGDSFYADPVALGAFAAAEKGILVTCSAGNSGPFNSSVANDAPWILTVGASTIDRSITATAKLGNKEEFDGQSAFQPKDFSQELLPLVYPGTSGDFLDYFCLPSNSTFQKIDVKGKVVLCQRGVVPPIEKGRVVKDAGGAAMILVNMEEEGYTTAAMVHVLPATLVSYADGQKIEAYINSTSKPKATILFKGTQIGEKKAPVVAAFSSRGPSMATPGILKPDIIGPGVSILAAWPLSVENKTHTKSTFNLLSGTSMSCPHLSGVAALLKSAHPDWSPAAIKSAIMTTADQLNLNKQPILDERYIPADIFAVGAGHVNPSKAKDPGLVYDVYAEDYIPYLCGLNYTSGLVSLIARRSVKCSAETSIPEAQLNYPSFAIRLGGSSTSQTYTRTVTNVGEAISSYDVKIISPEGVDVIVKPSRLEFSKMNQKLMYQVTFSRSTTSVAKTPYVQGFLSWTSAKYAVRSPISVNLQ